MSIQYASSDCNLGIGFSILGSGIEKFVSRDPVSGLGLQIGRHFGIQN